MRKKMSDELQKLLDNIEYPSDTYAWLDDTKIGDLLHIIRIQHEFLKSALDLDLNSFGYEVGKVLDKVNLIAKGLK
jgi:hypothetical protein